MRHASLTGTTESLPVRQIPLMRIGSRLLLILTALAVTGCASVKNWTDEIDTEMITRNDYANSMGMAKMLKDVEECGTQAVTERRRLQTEVMAGDAYFAEQAGSVETAQAVGKAITEISLSSGSSLLGPTTKKKSGELNTERMAADAAGALVGFVVDVITSDLDKHEQEMLVKDLDSLGTYVRFKHVCLRVKGYQVREYEKDGTGTAHLLQEPLRVVLRDQDGGETIMYSRPKDE